MLTSRSNPLLLQWPWSRRNRPLESILWNHANDRPYTITTVHISLMVWTRGCVISQISYVVFTNVFIRHDFTMTSCGSSYVNSKVLKQISWDSMNSYWISCKVCHNIFACICIFAIIGKNRISQPLCRDYNHDDDACWSSNVLRILTLRSNLAKRPWENGTTCWIISAVVQVVVSRPSV